MPEILPPADPLGLPQIATLANGNRVQITRADANDVVYNLLAPIDPLKPEQITIRTGALGVPGGTFATLAEVIAHLNNPPAPVVLRKQSTRVVLQRLTPTERAALRACTVPEIEDAYDVALIEGIVSEADPDFPAFRTALDQLGIIAASRWAALLA